MKDGQSHTKKMQASMLTKLKEIINLIFMLTKTVQIHNVNNNAFLNPLEDFTDEINDLIQQAGSLTIEGIEDNIYINEEKVKTDISTFASFKFILQEFDKKNVSGIAFLTTASFDELKNFFAVFALYPNLLIVYRL